MTGKVAEAGYCKKCVTKKGTPHPLKRTRLEGHVICPKCNKRYKSKEQ